MVSNEMLAMLNVVEQQANNSGETELNQNIKSLKSLVQSRLSGLVIG